MNKNYLFRTAASVAVTMMLTGCVDDKYDLTDIDTTSRITVSNLTVPINLGPIELENVLDLDDNENITIEGREYMIKKEGNISTSEFKVGAIKVNPADITPSTINVPTLGITVNGSKSFTVPASDKSTYDISMKDVDESLLAVTNVKTANPIEMKITLEVPSALTSNGNTVKFEQFGIRLPWGLTNVTVAGADATYQADGLLTVNSMTMGTDGKGVITINADGLDLGSKGEIGSDRVLSITGEVGLDGGTLSLTMNGVKLPDPLSIKANYSISSFNLASFSGKIDYRMDEVKIAPIMLNDLPDFLSNPETRIYLSNPNIRIYVENTVSSYGLTGTGRLKLTSNFAGDNHTTATSKRFHIDQKWSYIHLYEGSGHPDLDNFPGFSGILANDKVGGLPESIDVSVENLSFAGEVTDFPIYHDGQGTINGANGTYEFSTALSFDYGTKIVYEKTEGDWGGDDIDDINITLIKLTAICTTDIPVGIELQVLPIDKDGNLIPVEEDSSKFQVPAYCNGQEVQLSVRGKNGQVINHFDGIRFRAVITGDGHTGSLGPNLHIKLDNLQVTVDGYFEKEL